MTKFVYVRHVEDSIRDYLIRRRVGPHVIEGGLEYLVQSWARLASQVEDGERTWGDDEWLSDLGVREILHGLHENVPEAETAWPEVVAIDARFDAAAVETTKCVWGDRIANSEGWTQDVNWWYWREPTTPYEWSRPRD